MRRSTSLVVLVIVTSLVWPFTAVAQESAPRFEPAPCPFEMPAAVTCGYLIVPEVRGQPAGRTIRLAVAVIKSRSAQPAPDPVIFLEGGPGGSAFEFLGAWLGVPFLGERDFIVLEQRGTHFSEPALDCPEITAAFYQNLTVAEDQTTEDTRMVEAAQHCHDRLTDEGINLAGYNSAASAADLADLRQALGYTEWNLYAISYGTRLALTTLRDHPEGIRSVILDSTYPPQAGGYTEIVPGAVQSFERLFESCVADPQCQAAYPNLEANLFDLVERTNANPMRVTIPHPQTGEPMNLVLSGNDLMAGLFVSLYDADAIPYVPLTISQLREGNSNILAPLFGNGLSLIARISRGMQLSVDCYEEAPFNPASEVAAVAQRYPPAYRNFYPTPDLAICEIWNSGRAEPIETQPVTSNIPTLVLAGEFDPTTPPTWGKLAAASLSHSFYYEFPGLAHAVTNASCPMNMARAFVDDPTRAPQADCLSGMSEPHFVTDGDVYVTPAFYRLNTELLGKLEPLQLTMLGLCLTFFLIEIVFWPLHLVRRIRSRKFAANAKATTLARITAALMAGLSCVFLIGLMAAISQVISTHPVMLAFGLPATAAPLFLIPLLLIVLALGLVSFTLRAWQHRYWSLVGRIHYTLLTLSAAIFVGWLANWGLLQIPL